MHPSPRSKLALVLLTVLFAYNITAVLSTAAATDAASDEAESSAVEETATDEEAAPAEEAASAEEASAEEAAADDDSDGTFIEPVTRRATILAKANTAKSLEDKFSSGWARGSRAAKGSPRAFAPQGIAAPGDWKILFPGSNTEINSNAPHQGVCDFDVQWDGFAANTNYDYEFTSQTNPKLPVQGLSGTVTTDGNGDAKTSIQFNPTNLAALSVGAQGYHIKGEESGGKQKTFWVDSACAQDPGSPTLAVKKVTTGLGAPNDSFNFTGDAGPQTLANGQTSTPLTVTAGQVSITEVQTTNNTGTWSLTGVSCIDTANNNAAVTSNLNGMTATLTVANGQVVVCTFTNNFTENVVINPGTPGGTIIVDKVTLPSGASDSFAFSLTPQGGTAIPFNLTDAAAPFASNQPVGTYAVAETVPAGWDLSSATCSDGSSPAAVNLGSGEVVTCTFTNTQRGSITAVLDLVPLSGNGAARTILARFAATDFVFTGDLAATLLNDGDSIGPNEVAPATYSTTEIVPDGWDLTSIDCSDGNSSGNTGTGTATFVVDPGEDVVCTFTNVEEEVKGGVTGPGQPGAEDETPEVLARPATALPLTGSDPAGLIAIAALLILSGATSLLITRQRRSS